MKCRSACKNMTKKRHPVLFDLPSIHSLTIQEHGPLSSMFPSSVRIDEDVSEHLQTIFEKDIPNDHVLIELANLLSISECNGVKVGNAQMLMVCIGYQEHRVIQRMKTHSNLFTKFKNKSTYQD